MGNFARQAIQWAQTEGDPYWDNVVLLTRMDVNPPVDISNSAHTLTKGAGASVDRLAQFQVERLFASLHI